VKKTADTTTSMSHDPCAVPLWRLRLAYIDARPEPGRGAREARRAPSLHGMVARRARRFGAGAAAAETRRLRHASAAAATYLRLRTVPRPRRLPVAAKATFRCLGMVARLE